jgi:dTDP-4-dehydrorhamnose 3,5-epimerase
MLYRETPLTGAWIVEIEPAFDVRGFFARTWSSADFQAHGLEGTIVQSSLSRNERRGTIRGMHLQLPPSREAKLVRCTRGAIWDVIIDLRPRSVTFMQHFAAELSADRHDALYVPPLFAHGFQTLVDATEVSYQMTDVHAPELGFGLRWDDPAFAIRWPVAELTMLPRDAAYPDFDSARYLDRASGGA